MSKLSDIRGILFDLDGVFYIGDRAIDGVGEVIEQLQQKRIPFRFVTNTTVQSRASLAQKLQGMGLPVNAEQILSAPHAAVLYLRQRGYRSCHALVADEIKPEFAEFDARGSHPQAIIIGDIGEAWSYALLNHVFQLLMSGSQMIALHKNKFWQTLDGLHVDIGAFVAGLEYVTGQQAVVIGKPSLAFFELAVQQLGVLKQQVIMVGDDIDSDVFGAQQAGLKGVLVRTGKYREAYTAASSIKPDAVLDSVADLMLLF